MNLTSIQHGGGLWNAVGAGAGADALVSGQESFERILGRRPKEKDGPAAVRQAAEDFVSMALVQPVLKQLRETNNAAAPFAPGAAEKKFGGLLDAEFAARLVRSTRFGIVDAVAAQMVKKTTTPEDSKEVDSAPSRLNEGMPLREEPVWFSLKGGGS